MANDRPFVMNRRRFVASLAGFTAALHGGASDEQVAAIIASSDEYFLRFSL